MPLYRYECEECGMVVEHITSIEDRDAPDVECPKCGTGPALRRKLETPALHGEKYQMKAVLSDGTEVAGHFGKEAPLCKKR